MRKHLASCVVIGLLAFPCVARAQFLIESFPPFATVSGITIPRGLACQNQAAFVAIDNGEKFPLITGLARADAQSFCGGAINTGWAVLGNIGNLPPGAHTLNVFDRNNGLLGSVQFNAVSLGMPFIAQPNPFVTILQNQPKTGFATAIEFSVPDQAFRVTASRSRPGSPSAFDPFAAEFKDKDIELTNQVSGSVTKYKFSRVSPVNGGQALIQDLPNGTFAAFTNNPEGVLMLADFVSPYEFALIDTNSCQAAFTNRSQFNPTQSQQSQSIGVVVTGNRNTAGQCSLSFSQATVGSKAEQRIGVAQ